MENTNHSRHRPLGSKIIVHIHKVLPPKTKGGIILHEEARNKMAYMETCGVLEALGPTAFKYEKRTWWQLIFGRRALREDKPKLGDVLTFRSYAGIHIEHPGPDGEIYYYRALEDHEIHSVYE